MNRNRLVHQLRLRARPLRHPGDLDPVIERAAHARVVLLGEASHGTSEFYTWRAALTRRLIEDHGFDIIAVEGDWPDCYRVNRYIRALAGSGTSARDVLHAFDRWPTWLWANEEVVALAEWLRRYNDAVPHRQVGFYGLDVYSLWDSIRGVLEYLERVDPRAAARARRAYGCFDPYEQDVQEYAFATALVPTSCQDEAVSMLVELRRNAPQYREDGAEGFFDAEQNALVARNAEHYYRTMVRGGPGSWNVRDHHMQETLARLIEHHGPNARAVVWEHNTHVGDARATDMAAAGMVNVGQLARQAWGEDDVLIVGFASHRGTVIAADEWGADMDVMHVPPARNGSWEELLHEACGGDRLLLSADLASLPDTFERIPHRAIGVVYHPERERWGNYVPTVLPSRYDALLYIDHSHGLNPLHFPARRESGEPPETYPSGV